MLSDFAQRNCIEASLDTPPLRSALGMSGFSAAITAADYLRQDEILNKLVMVVPNNSD